MIPRSFFLITPPALFGAALLLCTASLAAGTNSVVCEAGNGGTAPAKLTVHAGAGHTLFVCAVKAKKRNSKLELSGFRVFSVGKNGKKKKKPLFESEADTKIFRAEKKGQELIVDELVYDGKANVPAFETKLSCDATGCHSSKPPVCVFEKPKPGSRRALEQVGDYQHGGKQGKVPPKKLVDSLAALAYSGDADAAKLFQDRGALSLDGEASDAYFDHQASLDRLRKAGCL